MVAPMVAPRVGDVVEVMWVDSEHIALGWSKVADYVSAAKHQSAYRTAGYWLFGNARVVVTTAPGRSSAPK